MSEPANPAGQATHPVAIVSGGGTGIGRAVAHRLVADGAQVVITGRRSYPLKRTAEEIGANIAWRQIDMSDIDSVRDLVDQVVSEYGRLDVCAAVAGGYQPVSTGTPVRSALVSWNDVLDGNLTSAFLLALTGAPHLTRPGGRIITVSSIGAHTGGSAPGALAYAAAKSGVEGLTLALARELSAEGITANCIAPGFVAQTEFFGDVDPATRFAGIAPQVPAGRPATPDEIADVCAFLAGPGSSYITGQVLHVNGGWRFTH
jgi:3-oxoacyl-[acyl-carrier protein] reductase